MRKCATLEGGKIRKGKEPLIPSSRTFSLWEKAIGLRFRVTYPSPTHEDAQDYDANRTQVLEAMGYHVIRLSNDDVYEDLDATIEAIWQALENARP